MEDVSIFVKIGNKILNLIILVFVLLTLFYAGYVRWYSKLEAKGGKLEKEIINLKPVGADDSSDRFAALKEINEDVVGWISIDDTVIDYPVVKGKNNTEYTNKDIYGEFTIGGSIYLDSRDKSDFSYSYNVIYGKNYSNGKMLGDLDKYLDEEYLKAHRTGTLYTEGKEYKLKVVASLRMNSENKEFLKAYDVTEADMERKILDLKDVAICMIDKGIKQSDKVLCITNYIPNESGESVAVICVLN